jgi:bacteriocin-like protein
MEILIELTEDELTQIAGGSGFAHISAFNTALSKVASAVTSVVTNFASHSASVNSAILTATAV